MYHSRVPLLGALALAAPLAAQCDHGAKTFTLPANIASVYWKSDNPNFTVQTTDQSKIYGGSVRPMRLTTLSAAPGNTLGPVGVGRIPVVVAETNTDRYWGLNVRADFVPLTLSGAPKQIVTGQEMVMIE